jgi:hypothetical protein
MATGAGKTKVLSLLVAWSYFHKLYEPESALARNFLMIAPNIIVLDRLRADFDGLRGKGIDFTAKYMAGPSASWQPRTPAGSESNT